MNINKIFDYVVRIAPHISYWKIILWSLVLIAVFEGIIFGLTRWHSEKIQIPRARIYCLIFYTNFVLRLTLFGRNIGAGKDGNFLLDLSINELLSNHGILNMMLFFPFGFFVYILFRRYDSFTKALLTALICLIFTLLIETVQLATKSGRFEVNDIVANGLGGILGCLPGYLVIHLLSMLSSSSPKKNL